MNLENIIVNTQSSIKIAGSKVLYFDPYEIVDDSKDADYIFITHDHPDHFQPQSISKVANEKTILVLPASMEKSIEKTDFDREHIVLLETFMSKTMEGVSIETVPAYNKLKPFHPKAAKFLGYIITLDDTRYYITGDTDLIDEIKTVKCDIIFVPIGGTFTMNAASGAKLVNTIKPKVAIPVHYGSIVGNASDFIKFKEKCDEAVIIEQKV